MKNFIFYSILFMFGAAIIVGTDEIPYIDIISIGIITVVSIYQLILRIIRHFKSNSKKYKFPYNPKDLV